MLGKKILGYTRIFVMALATIPFYLLTFVWRWGDDNLGKARLISAWCHTILPIFGFKVKTVGKKPPPGTYLYVCNHRSSLDPLIMLSCVNGYPVSKSAVRSYPLVGKGAKNAGVIFVDKKSRTSRSATKQAIYDALKVGRSVAIFPEGRTHANETTTTFLKGAYDVAAELNVPVFPMALDYKSKNDYWDHTDSMVVHFIKNLAKWRTETKIIYGEPVHSDNAFTLLRTTQSWINEQILEMRKSW